VRALGLSLETAVPGWLHLDKGHSRQQEHQVRMYAFSLGSLRRLARQTVSEVSDIANWSHV
jgi:hypothetical protein